MRGAAFLVVVRGMAVVICRNGDIDVKNPGNVSTASLLLFP